MNNKWLGCKFCIVLFLCFHIMPLVCTALRLPIFCLDFFSVHQYSAYGIHSSQASHLLFELLFHASSFTAFFLFHHQMPTAHLLFYHSLLVHTEFLYLSCLTVLGCFFALQKTYIPLVFLYVLMLSRKFLAA